jgi:hypothetical protein
VLVTAAGIASALLIRGRRSDAADVPADAALEAA